MVEQRDHWLRYYEWLRAEVEDRPMFGQNADGPSLADIFVPLRCTWREWPRDRFENDEEGGGEERTVVHVRWLLDELRAWLANADKRDVLRVVTGGPGCGKSSTAKMLARDVARTDEYNVFLVPLQGLDVSRDIGAIVADYVDYARYSGISLPESPINWIRHDPKPLLIIFDGLDEVAQDGVAGLEVTRKFLESLRFWLSRVNADAGPRVMAVTLGRPQAAEEAVSKIGGLDGPCLLYAEPLCLLDEERLNHGLHSGIVIDDPYELASKDYRRRFWDAYARFDPRYRDVEPEVLQETSLNDLTVEPLLLFLLMYSGLAGKDWPEAKENRNRIYEAIFAQVHERDRREKLAIAVDDREDFFTLMECLGLAAWMGGGRTGSDENFEYIRDEIYAPDRKRVFKDLDQASLKNVAVQFYTQHGSREQPGYEFVHKSFGEYLTARALIKASEIWCDEYGKRNKWGSFAEDWLRLTGRQSISVEIIRFMADEVRLMIKPQSDDEPDIERSRQRVKQLRQVANLTEQDGFPIHRIFPATVDGANWHRRQTYHRNAGDALKAAIKCWTDAERSPSGENYDGKLPTSQELARHANDCLDQAATALVKVPPRPSLIGHNNPPEEIEAFSDYNIDEAYPDYGTDDVFSAASAIVSLKIELNSGEPSQDNIEEKKRILLQIISKLGNWLAAKADRAVDKAIDWLVPIGAAALSAYVLDAFEKLHVAVTAIEAWAKSVGVAP